jgi:hypothetical protein
MNISCIYACTCIKNGEEILQSPFPTIFPPAPSARSLDELYDWATTMATIETRSEILLTFFDRWEEIP